MLLKLKLEMNHLLVEVIKKRRPDLLSLMPSQTQFELTESERDEIVEAVVDEFTETGLEADDEPNSRGILLDDLIGALTIAADGHD
jgi:hypothetical protein